MFAWRRGFILFYWYSHLLLHAEPLSTSPAAISSKEKCCIASLCAAEAPRWDQELTLRILSHLSCSAAASPGHYSRCPQQVAFALWLWAATCFAPVLVVSEGHCRHWSALTSQISPTGLWDNRALKHQQWAVWTSCPSPCELPRPSKGFKSPWKCSCNLHISKTALQKILHFTL